MRKCLLNIPGLINKSTGYRTNLNTTQITCELNQERKQVKAITLMHKNEENHKRTY